MIGQPKGRSLLVIQEFKNNNVIWQQIIRPLPNYTKQ